MGRKRSVYIGLVIFVIGTLICLTTFNYSWMLAGRILQGLGVAAPRISTVAIVRDLFALSAVWKSFRLVFGNRKTLGHSISAGLVFATLIGYLTTARQIFQDYLGIGRLFVVYFAFAALSVGIASILNAGLVRRIGMHRISHVTF